jgi:hypothetical protein
MSYHRDRSRSGDYPTGTVGQGRRRSFCRSPRPPVGHRTQAEYFLCAPVKTGAVLSMQVRDVEGVATHNGPESCVGRGNPDRRSADRGTCRPGIEPRNLCAPGSSDGVRGRRARDVVVVRFADDFVAGFEHREEAECVLMELRERFARFGLTLHPDKTRLIEFGRYAAGHRRDRGDGKPETFNFLGFTHACSQTRKGRFTVLRQTMRQRWQTKLREVKAELRRRLHAPIPHQGAYLRSVILGHTRYYGVPRNGPRIGAFHLALGRRWRATLRRRSQNGFVSWARMRV